jgi:hypothetical protein
VPARLLKSLFCSYSPFKDKEKLALTLLQKKKYNFRQNRPTSNLVNFAFCQDPSYIRNEPVYEPVSQGSRFPLMSNINDKIVM